jgi:MFS family permease
MLDTLGWSKAQAGLVASANFVGYLVGALTAARKIVSANPRLWLLGALTISGVTTAAMGFVDVMPSFIGLRFLGGMASAFVIVCASTLVLERLAATGQRQLSAVHFSGVGIGIFVSAALVAGLLQQGVGWAFLWMGAGLLATALVPLVAWLTRGHKFVGVSAAG